MWDQIAYNLKKRRENIFDTTQPNVSERNRVHSARLGVDVVSVDKGCYHGLDLSSILQKKNLNWK